MSRFTLQVVLFVSFAALASACRCGGEPDAPEVPAEPSEPAANDGSGTAAAQTEPAEEGPCGGQHPDAVALVDCNPVMTSAELDAALADTVERYERLPGREPTTAEWRNERRRRIVRSAVQEAILQQHVADAGIAIDDATVEARLRDELEHVYEDERLFERFLDSRGTSREEYLEEVRSELALDAVLAERARANCTGDPETTPNCRLEPSDQDVQTFYQQNRERWREGERVRASNITIRLRPNAEEADVAAARARIEALRQRVVDGEDFAEVAATESESADRVRGGDRGWIVRGRRQQLVEDGVEDVLFGADIGELTEIVRTDLGFQFFLIADKRPEGFRDLDEVRDILHEPLRRRNRDRLSRELENDLIQEMNVIYNEDVWNLETEGPGADGSGTGE